MITGCPYIAYYHIFKWLHSVFIQIARSCNQIFFLIHTTKRMSKYMASII